MLRSLGLSVLFLFAFVGNARAEASYPGEIQSHLGLNYTLQCTICHATNLGGIGTVVTPFGTAMRNHGLTTDIGTLDPALDALASAGTDSNGDGVSDIQQLKNGVDPNTGKSVSSVEKEQFGCGARIARQSPAPAGYGLMLLGVVLTIFSRRRTRRLACPSYRRR
jgi:hypothetical protein